MGGPACRAARGEAGGPRSPPTNGEMEKEGKAVETVMRENMDPGDGQESMDVEAGAAGSPEKGAAPPESTVVTEEREEEIFYSPLPQRTQAEGLIPLDEGSGDVPPREGEPLQQQGRE